jgi:hypothetical protein
MSLLDEASLIVTPNAGKEGKLYSVVPSNGNGDFTATRATTATRVNSAGLIESVASNIPRLDYSLGSCPNLLLEPQRTNLALRSEEFNLTWASIRLSVTPNTTIAPDGNTTADSLIENTATGARVVRQSINTTVSLHTFSVYAKANTRNWIYLSNSITGSTFFDLSNGTIGFTPVGVTASITNVGNGWYRCATVFTGTIALNAFDIGLSTGNNISSYTGDGTSGLYVWGAQLEAGAYPTSYIPTTSASVTRNSDVISKGDIFTNGLITASGGTWFVDLSNNTSVIRDGITGGLSITTNSTVLGNAITIRNRNSSVNTSMQLVRVLAGTSTGSIYTFAENAKIAIKWNGTSFDAFENGVKVVSEYSFTETEMQNLILDGTVRSFQVEEMALFPTPLTDTQCIELTTL